MMKGFVAKVIGHIRKEKVAYAIMALATLFVVAIRLPMVWGEDPKNMNWLHGVMMRHVEIFEMEPSLKNLMAPPLTYPEGPNRFIDNNSANEEGRTGFMSEEGRYYYLSYPPLAFMVAQLLFFLSPIDVSLLGMGLLGMFVQAVAAFLLFLFVRELTSRASWGVIAFVLYLFASPSAVWHSAMYFPDTLVQPLFVLSAYMFYRAFVSGKATSRRYAWAYAVSLFLMCYTDWLGYLFAVSAGAYSLVFMWRRGPWTAFFVSATASSAALVATFSQYATVIGPSRFLSIFVDKYSNSYVNGNPSVLDPQKYLNILAHYSTLEPLVWMTALCLVVFVAVVVFRGRDALFSSISSVLPLRDVSVFVSCLFGLPFLLHHAVFFHWTSHIPHGFSILKSLPFLIVALVLLGACVWKSPFGRVFWTRAFLVGVFVWSLGVWVSDIAFGNAFAVPVGSSVALCEAGKRMSERAPENAIVFVRDVRAPGKIHSFPINPVIVYCSKRNIAVYEGRAKAHDLMRVNGVTEGVIFSLAYFNAEGVEILKEERISAPQR